MLEASLLLEGVPASHCCLISSTKILPVSGGRTILIKLCVTRPGLKELVYKVFNTERT